MTLRLSRPPPGSVMYRLIHSTSRCARSISEYTCCIILNRVGGRQGVHHTGMRQTIARYERDTGGYGG